jgi:hypothetical protein
MNNHLIKTVMLAALMNVRTAVAQTNPPVMPATPQVTSQLVTVGSAVRADPMDARLSAPIGHRQPRPKDITVGEAGGKLDHIDAESAAVDRKLNICRGC